MMLKSTIFTVCIILGAAVAEPLRIATNNEVVPEYPYEMSAKTNPLSVIETISALMGYKTTALSIAITVIQWVVSNFSVVLIGAATVLGFCKLTGKCSLNYEDYIPINQIQSYATPENLETAERFLYTAVEKYAEERKRSLN